MGSLRSPGSCSRLPIFGNEAGHAGKLGDIIRDHHGTNAESMTGEKGVIVPDGLRVGLERREVSPHPSGALACRIIKGKNVSEENSQQREPRRSASRIRVTMTAIFELKPDHGGEHAFAATLVETRGQRRMPPPQGSAARIGIEQVKRHTIRDAQARIPAEAN